MERITIELGDDGRVTVTAESPGEETETMDFDNVMEASDAVRELLIDAEEDIAEGGGQGDAAAMWNEEADKRMNDRMAMRVYE